MNRLQRANEEAAGMWSVYRDDLTLLGKVVLFPFILPVIAVNWVLELLFVK